MNLSMIVGIRAAVFELGQLLMQGFTDAQIRIMGRWKSTAFIKYICITISVLLRWEENVSLLGCNEN